MIIIYGQVNSDEKFCLKDCFWRFLNCILSVVEKLICVLLCMLHDNETSLEFSQFNININKLS